MIIEYGGKQHLAEPGSRFTVNQADLEEGQSVKAKDLLSGESVTLKVTKVFLGEKIDGLKFKNKIRYTRRYGHRQQLAMLEVSGNKATEPKKADETPVKTKSVAKKTASKKAAKKVSK